MSSSDQDAMYEAVDKELVRLGKKRFLDDQEVEYAMRCYRLMFGKDVGFKLVPVQLNSE